VNDERKSGDTTVRLKPAIASAAEGLCSKLSRACHKIAVVGAVRRRDIFPTCIDLLAIPKVEPMGDRPDHNYLWAVLDYFYSDGGYLKRGALMRSFRVRLNDRSEASPLVPANIYLATEETWGNNLAHRTGPEGFWFNLLGKLNLHGYTSVDGRILRIEDSMPVFVPDEPTVFALAQMRYREAWQRGGTEKARGSW
jgi:hypothetical protein